MPKYEVLPGRTNLDWLGLALILCICMYIYIYYIFFEGGGQIKMTIMVI